MAECIAQGLLEADPTLTVKLYNSAVDDKNDIVTEVFKSKAILVGSPTINYGFLYSIGGIMEMIRGLKFKNKKAAAFGSYGWSGEAVKQITALLQGAGLDVVNDGLRCQWNPDQATQETCRQSAVISQQPSTLPKPRKMKYRPNSAITTTTNRSARLPKNISKIGKKMPVKA